MQYLDAASKMTEIISVCFQSKPFNITVIQVDVSVSLISVRLKKLKLNSSMKTYKTF